MPLVGMLVLMPPSSRMISQLPGHSLATVNPGSRPEEKATTRMEESCRGFV
jgi:hypothetical protein